MGNESGNLVVAVQDRVLLFVWVVGWIWMWFGGRNTLHSGLWVRHGKFSDVDLAAVLTAGGMFVFSFAPAYTYVTTSADLGPDQCSFPDEPEQARCILDNWHTVWNTPRGINAWHETSTAAPVVLVLIVATLVVIRGLFPWLVPAVLVRIATRLMLLLATLILGWAVFNPSDAIFDGTHYAWGLWAELGCLSLLSIMAMSRPPRFLAWLIA